MADQHTSMYERAYFEVQKVLNKALGTELEHGAGEGIAADVWLLAKQRDDARTALESALQLVTEVIDCWGREVRFDAWWAKVDSLRSTGLPAAQEAGEPHPTPIGEITGSWGAAETAMKPVEEAGEPPAPRVFHDDEIPGDVTELVDRDGTVWRRVHARRFMWQCHGLLYGIASVAKDFGPLTEVLSEIPSDGEDR